MRASGISEEAIEATGYRTVTDRAELTALGFKEYQARVPGLLCPIWSPAGQIVSYQLRPDSPRMRDGKPVKYESLPDRGSRLHAPPIARERVADPSTPLLITEGVKKADAAASAGYACVGLAGIWNWKRRNEHEGSVTIGDLENIPLRGRQVYLVFDSDAADKPAVRKAEKRLAGFLRSRGTVVRVVRLPSPGGGAKTGLDDFLAAGGDLEALLAEAREAAPEAAYGGPREYAFADGCTVWYWATPDGPVPVRLANFEAEIVATVERRNGLAAESLFEVEARQNGKSVRRLMSPKEFSRMDWPIELLGPAAVVEPGQGTRDRFRAAVQKLSPAPERRVVLSAAGWHQIADRWVFAHAKGALGAQGVVEDVEVQIGTGLRQYAFDRIAGGGELADWAALVLRFLDVAPLGVAAPFLGAYLRAALGRADFAVWVCGPTQSRKSSLAAALLGLYGREFASDRLPIEWSSTDNAIEGLAFEAADLPLVVDDWVAARDRGTREAMTKKAARILRSAGNRSGRSRASADGSVRGARSVRALVVLTAETVPEGMTSELNRTLCLELRRDDVRNDVLAELQQAGRDGRLSAGTASFLSWLVGRLDDARERLAAAVEPVRTGDRLDEQLAQIGFAFDLFLEFAIESGLSASEAEAARCRFRSGLAVCRERQRESRSHADPVQTVIEAIWEGFASGRCYVRSRDGERPSDPGRWGWARGPAGDWAESKLMLGWLDETQELLFLLPGQLEAFVEQSMASRGRPLGTSVKSAMLQAADRGLVELGDRKGPAVRRAEGKSVRVWVLRAKALHMRDHTESSFPPCSADAVAPVAAVAPKSDRFNNGPVAATDKLPGRVAAGSGEMAVAGCRYRPVPSPAGGLPAGGEAICIGSAPKIDHNRSSATGDTGATEIPDGAAAESSDAGRDAAGVPSPAGGRWPVAGGEIRLSLGADWR